MDIREIKQFLEDGKGKVVFIENGEVSFVLLSYQEYKKLVEGREKENLPARKEKEVVFGLINKEEEPRELTIDDLPF